MYSFSTSLHKLSLQTSDTHIYIYSCAGSSFTRAVAQQSLKRNTAIHFYAHNIPPTSSSSPTALTTTQGHHGRIKLLVVSYIFHRPQDSTLGAPQNPPFQGCFHLPALLWSLYSLAAASCSTDWPQPISSSCIFCWLHSTCL